MWILWGGVPVYWGTEPLAWGTPTTPSPGGGGTAPSGSAWVYWGGVPLYWGGVPLSWGVPSPGTGTPGSVGSELPPGAVWKFAYGPASGANPTRELTVASGRVVTWRVDGHPFAQFTLDGRHDEAIGIVERRDDLWVHRDGVLVFRGRIVGAEDRIDGDRHTVQFLAVGYRGLLSLAAKVEPPVPTWTGVDQAQIVWQLVDAWQALDGADWGITEGVGTTSGQLRDETDLSAFTPVGEAIDRIMRLDNGGEWDISPTLELDRWFPQRGGTVDVTLDYGGTIQSVERSLPEFGNVAGATGSQDTAPTLAEAADVASDERGRWTVAQGYPSIKRQATLDDKATWLLDQVSTVEFEWRATFSPRRWPGPSSLWIGDIATFSVKSGRIQVSGPHRVVELQAVPGEDGTETITVGLVGVAA